MHRSILSLLLTIVLVWVEATCFAEYNGHQDVVYITSQLGFVLSMFSLWGGLHFLFFGKDKDELE